MPQKKQEQYEDALGSIFDFIFTESQKPPSKSKPLKVTGIDGTTEIVDALAAAVENPAMFVNENTLNAFQDFVDIDLAKINLDQRGGQIRFRLKNIGKMLRDPNGYIDSQFKTAEAIRKSQRMAAAGEAMRGVVAGSWAAKKGLDYETRRALAGVGRPDEFSQGMMTRADKLMQKHFSSGSYSVKKRQLVDKYGATKGEELFNFYRKAEKAYHTGSEMDRAAIFSNKNISDLYSFLEAGNIREKARFETDPQKKQDYRSASRFVENISAVGELRKVMDESKKRMKYHQDQIRDLKKQGAPQSVIDKHRKSIRDLRSDYNTAQRYEFASNIGTFEGQWNTAKELFIDGNLFANIINGDFFNDNRNQIGWLQPARQLERTFTTKVGLRGNKSVKGTVKFLGAKEGSNKFQQSYYDAMTPLYYLSPVTWVKSLGNGEVFAYRASVIEKAFKKKMSDVLAEKIAGFDMNKFMEEILNGNGEAYLGTLTASIAPDLLKKMEKFIGDQERWNKLAYNFSAISRAKDAITKRLEEMIEKRLGGDIKKVVGERLLKVAFIQKFGKDAVEAWMLKGGFRSLVRGVVTAALQAVGFSIAGPVGNAVVTALSWVATDVVMKIAKPVLKFGVNVALLVIVGGFGLIVLLFGSFYMMTFGKFSHVAPNEIVMCEEYRDLGLTPIEEDEIVCCDGETFSKVEGLPSYSSIPSQAKDYFNTYIQTRLTPELADVYAKASKETGIPCEIIMGIHYMEGGMDPGRSLFDGDFLKTDLLTDAIGAMEHLKGKMGMAGVPADSVKLTYEGLVVGLANYNGSGNANCSISPMTGVPRPTRWKDSGRCPVKYGFDHIYPVNWISPQHTNMDLIYCKDTVEYTCNREATEADATAIATRYEKVMLKPPPDGFVESAMNSCFVGSNGCNPVVTDNNTRKYPLFQRPGVLTTAILAHQSSLMCSGGGGGAGGGGGTGGVVSGSQCRNLPKYTGDTSNNPYGSKIVNVARTITASSSLGQGHWNYFNRPLSGMPNEYSHNGGRLKWNQDKFINNRDDTSYLSEDIFSLYWCTWLTHDSYVGGGVPRANTVFNAFSARTQLSQFISYGNGYDFICNGPGVVKGISPGDVIFYTWLSPNDPGYGTVAAHVGIVASVSGTTIKTYESNTSRPSITLTVNADGSIGRQAGLYTLGFGRYR